MERLSKNDYEVRPCALKEAQDLVRRYHYAKGGSNTGTHVHGLYRKSDGALVGAAWWIPPTRTCAESVNREEWQRVLSLSRLVVMPDVPGNAASFLLGKSMKIIAREGKWKSLVTYADEFMQHTGAIYKATNWEYAGMGSAEARWEDDDGRQIARKAGGKTRRKAEMEALGYRMVGRYRKHKFVKHLGRRTNA